MINKQMLFINFNIIEDVVIKLWNKDLFYLTF